MFISTIIVGLASISIESSLPRDVAYLLVCVYFSIMSCEKYKINTIIIKQANVSWTWKTKFNEYKNI